MTLLLIYNYHQALLPPIHIAHTVSHSSFANSDPTENFTSGNLGKSPLFSLHDGVVIFLAAPLPVSIDL